MNKKMILNNGDANMKYVIYARKSTDNCERQVQSIEGQLINLKKLAKDRGLNVVKIYEESKSAKEPDTRPLFTEMMNKLKKGEFQGILCWHLDRLARNVVEGSRLQWLLQKNIIRSIHSMEKVYLPNDNILMAMLEYAIAAEYVRALSINVRRGLDLKLSKGIYPGTPPLGYLIEKNEEGKKIGIDPERFTIIRKIWELMFTGCYNPSQILKIANNEWGLRTRRTHKLGDKPLSLSGIYKMLSNIFYTGQFEFNGKIYTGKHTPMITLDEFDLVQRLLGRKGKPRPRTHEFAFTGLIRCGECGCLCTAEEKIKLLKNGESRKHTYYHCTHKKPDINCTQRKNIRKEDLEKQIEDELSKITILPQFRDWALEILSEQNDKEIEAREKIYENQQRSLSKTQNELDELTKMRYRDLIDDDEYKKQKEELKINIDTLKKQIDMTEIRAENWLELTEATFDFATYARDAFINGDVRTKKEIFTAMGQNYIIEHGKLKLELNKWFVPIKNFYPELEQHFIGLEPRKNKITKEKNDVLEGVKDNWLGWKESNPHIRNQNPLSYH